MTVKQQRYKLNHDQSISSEARLIQISNFNCAANRRFSSVDDLQKELMMSSERQESTLSQHVRVNEML